MTTTIVLEDDEVRDFARALGIRIRLLRKEKKINMREIALHGFYDSQWRKYESGGAVNFSTLMKIALTLKVNLRELLDGLGQWPDLSVSEIQAQHSIHPDHDSDPDLDSVAEAEAALSKARPASKKTAAKKTVTRVPKKMPKKMPTASKSAARRSSKSAK